MTAPLKVYKCLNHLVNIWRRIRSTFFLNQIFLEIWITKLLQLIAEYFKSVYKKEIVSLKWFDLVEWKLNFCKKLKGLLVGLLTSNTLFFVSSQVTIFSMKYKKVFFRIENHFGFWESAILKESSSLLLICIWDIVQWNLPKADIL